VGTINNMDTLNINHYVPVLRWKRGERVALLKMSREALNRLTPLIELVDANYFGSKHAAISNALAAEKIAGQLAEEWGVRPIFIDAGFLGSEITRRELRHPLALVGESVYSVGIPVVPVTSLNRDEGYQQAALSTARMHKNGICIRLTREDIWGGNLTANLSRVTEFFGLSPEQIDLVVDFKIVDGTTIPYANLCSEIPEVARWRNFVVLSGAFPKDLTGLEKNRIHRSQRRLDWLSWSTQLNMPSIKRFPVYGDYTIQFPEQVARIGPMNISASIRYTAKDYWIILRGEGIQNPGGSGAHQWPAWAILLCDEPEYCGEDFSYGDRYIKEMSSELRKTGSAETWLRAGINHHMTFVMNQIANPS
jgi:hypothetical protein